MHPANTIEITGGLQKQRQLAYNLIEYCIDEMLPRHRSLWIECNLSAIPKKERCVGYCQHDSGNDFTLEIDKNQNLYDFLLTIAHEMVHVKQYVRKELKEDFPQTIWFNKVYSDGRCYPWELEAWKLQKPLTHGFIKKRLEKRIKDIISIDKRL
tara:strand:- start:287 stop:748 length:462 start_codon:yes stop_codon:yes gene_type:complete